MGLPLLEPTNTSSALLGILTVSIYLINMNKGKTAYLLSINISIA